MADNYSLNPMAGFKAYRDAYHGAPSSQPALKEKALTTRGLDLLRQDVLDGRLPQVSWICATKAGSEHPSPSSPAQGADYTARVLDALTANPEVWSKTVLLLMFDENDGFFDHAPPPAPPSRDAAGALAGADASRQAMKASTSPATNNIPATILLKLLMVSPAISVRRLANAIGWESSSGPCPATR